MYLPTTGRAARAFFVMLPLTRRAAASAFGCARPIQCRSPFGRCAFMSMSTSTPSTDESESQAPSLAPFFRIFYNDVYEVILPDGHRFPMEKYGRVRRRVQE